MLVEYEPCGNYNYIACYAFTSSVTNESMNKFVFDYLQKYALHVFKELDDGGT